MRLTTRDRRVLQAVHLRAGKEIGEIASIAECRPHAARYSLEKLLSEGVLERRWLIDSFRLGWPRCGLYLSVAPLSKTERARFTKFLADSAFTGFVCEVGGGLDFVVSMYARTLADVLAFQEEITSRFGAIIRSKSVVFRDTLSLFERRYLEKLKSPRKVITFSRAAEHLSQDEATLLHALDTGRNESLRQVADRLNIPATTVTYRLNRLRERGIVLGAVYVVHAARIGAQTFILSLYARGMQAGLREKLFAFARSNPHSIHFLDGVGEWDFDLDVEVEDNAQLQRIKEDLDDRFRDSLQETRVTPVFRVLKNGFFPTIMLAQ